MLAFVSSIDTPWASIWLPTFIRTKENDQASMLSGHRFRRNRVLDRLRQLKQCSALMALPSQLCLHRLIWLWLCRMIALIVSFYARLCCKLFACFSLSPHAFSSCKIIYLFSLASDWSERESLYVASSILQSLHSFHCPLCCLCTHFWRPRADWDFATTLPSSNSKKADRATGQKEASSSCSKSLSEFLLAFFFDCSSLPSPFPIGWPFFKCCSTEGADLICLLLFLGRVSQ